MMRVAIMIEIRDELTIVRVLSGVVCRRTAVEQVWTDNLYEHWWATWWSTHQWRRFHCVYTVCINRRQSRIRRLFPVDIVAKVEHVQLGRVEFDVVASVYQAS